MIPDSEKRLAQAVDQLQDLVVGGLALRRVQNALIERLSPLEHPGQSGTGIGRDRGVEQGTASHSISSATVIACRIPDIVHTLASLDIRCKNTSFTCRSACARARVVRSLGHCDSVSCSTRSVKPSLLFEVSSRGIPARHSNV